MSASDGRCWECHDFAPGGVCTRPHLRWERPSFALESAIARGHVDMGRPPESGSRERPRGLLAEALLNRAAHLEAMLEARNEDGRRRQHKAELGAIRERVGAAR